LKILDRRISKARQQNTKHMKYKNQTLPVLFAVLLGALLIPTTNVRAASAAEINRQAHNALQELYAKSPAARRLGEEAKAILIFPGIVKAGFIVGAQQGDGALISHGRTVGYYKTIAASYGLQAGVQKFGFALFFMTDEDLRYLNKSGGWEIGTGPSVVIVDAGMAKSFTTTTLRKGVYAFAFGQKGLMAGLGLQGSKITRIHPK
jgi:lipid-binding SYLF domain-containing protein